VIITKEKGIDLFEFVEKFGLFSEKTLRPLAKNLLTILKDIHKEGIIHKDIKPENIVYDGTVASIIDFEGKQTDDYRSPEQVVNYKTVSFKTDMWSLGATFYYLLTRNVPFKSERRILNSDYKRNSEWSSQFVNFLDCLLEKDENRRYDAKKALKHIWLAKN
jgi:serine/threonine protein kinase